MELMGRFGKADLGHEEGEGNCVAYCDDPDLALDLELDICI